MSQAHLPEEAATETAGSAPSPDEVRAQLARLLTSDQFAKAPVLRRFLQLLVERRLEGRTDEVKEYALGVDVFDRGDDFDPRIDTIVRVQARRLRERLDEYYRRAGHDDPVVIELPKGSYVVRYLYRTPSVELAEARDGVTLTSHSPADTRFIGITRRWPWAVAVAAGIGLLSARPWVVTPPTSPGPSGWATTVPVHTFRGEALQPSASADGSRLAFVWDAGDGHQIHVKHIEAPGSTQLTVGPGGKAYPAWSPDGLTVAFLHQFVDTVGRPSWGVFLVPSSGGAVRPLFIDPANSRGRGLDWSPDGARLVLSARRDPKAPREIAFVDVATGHLAFASATPGTFEGEFPVFSPTGRDVAFVAAAGAAVHVFNLQSGAVRRLEVARHEVRRVAWERDGSNLIFSSFRDGTAALWRLSVETAALTRLEGVGSDAFDPSVARRTGRLFYVDRRRDTNLYRVSLATGRLSGPLSPTSRMESHPDISPDGGRIAFVSDRSGARELWVMNADGSTAHQLTRLNSMSRHPRWSPSGSAIVFGLVGPSGTGDLGIVDVVTGAVRTLLPPDSLNKVWPHWSSDGSLVYYSSFRGERFEAWKVPSAGGPAERVEPTSVRRARESTDGAFLYTAILDATAHPSLWRRPTTGGHDVRVLRLPKGTSWGGEWVPVSHGVYWLNETTSPSSIEFFSFATGRSQRVFTPPSPYDSGAGFSVSPDGTWLVFAQRDYVSTDIMMSEPH